ncbi:MAG: hypothetical protein AAFZ65_04575 [Planctomycetota bacterium]
MAFELDLPVRPGVPVQRRVVRGRVLIPDSGPGPWPYVVLVHGYLAFMDWAFIPALAERLRGVGIAAVALNLSGAGIGPDLADFTDPVGFAHNTYEQELEDLAAVADAIEGGELGPLDLDAGGLWGHSRGSAMAVLHADRRQSGPGPAYRSIATWASAARVGRYESARLEEWRAHGYLWVQLADGRRLRLERDLLDDFESRPERLDVLQAAGRLDLPVLLLQGERDRNVLEAEARELERAYPEGRATVQVIEGAGHNFAARHPLTEVRPPLEAALSVTAEHFARTLR